MWEKRFPMFECVFVGGGVSKKSCCILGQCQILLFNKLSLYYSYLFSFVVSPWMQWDHVYDGFIS